MTLELWNLVNGCHVVDTFPAFLEFWPTVEHKATDAQVDAWASVHMSQWPELLQKQQEDYASQQEDWRQIACERVFPFLTERLPAMKEAHRHLLEVLAPVHAQARALMEFEGDMFLVIYVGVGCGAGWVTTFRGLPAILFGLENVAEEGWTQPHVLRGLVAHEFGHLVHFQRLAQHGRHVGEGPWWQLYEEGYAQRCEHLILGQETWHMASNAGDWLDWCREHKSWLAAEYLRAVEAGESVRPFFGSWFDIQGRKQCGYYLGHQAIRQLEGDLGLKEIARLGDVETTMKRELRTLASGSV